MTVQPLARDLVSEEWPIRFRRRFRGFTDRQAISVLGGSSTPVSVRSVTGGGEVSKPRTRLPISGSQRLRM
jgi:hypothetical protein